MRRSSIIGILFVAGIAVVCAAYYLFTQSESAHESIPTPPSTSDTSSATSADPIPAVTPPEPTDETDAEIALDIEPMDYEVVTLKVYGTVTDAATGSPIVGALVAVDSYFDMTGGVGISKWIKGDDLEELGISPDDLQDQLGEGAPLPPEVDALIEGHEMAHAVTGEHGNFELVVSPEFEEQLYCRAEGYAFASRPLPSEASGSARIDFLLRPGGAISGTVTDAITGEPVPGVTVIACEPNAYLFEFNVPARGGATQHATTETDGTYIVSGMPSGTFQVGVTGRELGYIFDSDHAATITLPEEGEAKDVHLVVTKGASIAGTVVNADGNPIAGATVSAAEVEPRRDLPFPVPSDDVTAVSGEDGTFEILGVRFGTPVTLKAEHSKYARAETDAFSIENAEQPTDIEIMMTPGCTVSGTAKFEDGEAASETWLILRRTKDLKVFGFEFDQTTLTDEQGVFTFEHVPAGEHEIGSHDMIVVFGADEKPKGTVVKTDGANDVAGLEIVVPRDARPAEEGDGEIKGTVYTQDGKPAEGATVGAHDTSNEFSVEWADSETTTEGDGTFVLSSLSGEEYRIVAQTPTGDAFEDSVKPGQEIALHLGPVTGVEGMVSKASGEPVSNCVVTLNAPPSEGPETMASMMSRMTSMFSESGYSATTDDFGRFEFKHVVPGDYVADAKSHGVGSGTAANISVVQGSVRTDVNIVLEAGVDFAVLVTDGSGQPIGGANGRLAPTTGLPFESMFGAEMFGMAGSDAIAANSGPDGLLLFPGVPKGTHSLSVKHANFAPYVEKSIEISGVQGAPLKVSLGLGGAAKGTYRIDGQAKSGVMIQLIGENGIFSAFTNEQGLFEVTGLPAGVYMATATDLGSMMQVGDNSDGAMTMSTSLRTVNVTEGGVVEFEFGSGVNVSGSVTGLDPGKPGVVSLRRPGGPDPSTIDTSNPFAMMEMGFNFAAEYMQYQAGTAFLQPDGTFDLGNIDPGEYILEVTTMDFSFDPEAMEELMDTPIEEFANREKPTVLRREITVGEEPLQVDLTVESDALQDEAAGE